MNPLKLLISSFFSFVLGLIYITAAGYYYFPAIALKAAAESDTDLTCIVFSHNSL